MNLELNRTVFHSAHVASLTAESQV